MRDFINVAIRIQVIGMGDSDIRIKYDPKAEISPADEVTVTYSTSTMVYDIIIKQIGNGYVVYRDGSRTLGDTIPIAVFNDFYDMCNWMREYYSEPTPDSEEPE